MACHESFARGLRQSKGLPGGILGILYIAALPVLEGQTLGSPEDENFDPRIEIVSVFGIHSDFRGLTVTLQEDGSSRMKNPGPTFYSDLPEAEQEFWVSKLNRQSVLSSSKPLNYEGYKYHPATYLFCTKDMTLPLEAQKTLVEGLGVQVRHEFCDSGHSPFLTQPSKVLDLIEQIGRGQ